MLPMCNVNEMLNEIPMLNEKVFHVNKKSGRCTKSISCRQKQDDAAPKKKIPQKSY